MTISTSGLRDRDYYIDEAKESLSLWCSELLSKCQNLKTVIIEWQCSCLKERNRWADFYAFPWEKGQYCYSPELREKVLQPLLQLHSCSTGWKCDCRAAAELTPVFQDFAGKVRVKNGS